MLFVLVAGCGGSSGARSSGQATRDIGRLYRQKHPGLDVAGFNCIREEGKQRTFDCSGTVIRPGTDEKTDLQLVALASEDRRHYAFTDTTDYAAVKPPAPPIPGSAVASAVLKAAADEKGSGVASLVNDGSNLQLVVVAHGLKPTTKTTAYEVWLYNGAGDARAIGAQFTNRRGGLKGQGTLRSDYKRFHEVVVSREKVGTNPHTPTTIVLRGTVRPV